MEFELSDIKHLAEGYGKGSLDRFPTRDGWLDNRYHEHYVLIDIYNKYYRLFYRIAKLYEPKFVVELGSWWATAAAHFAAGCPTTDVVTIDAHREVHPGDDVACVKAHEAADHYDNLHFIHGWTWDEYVVTKVRARPYPIDILFIDAEHTYEAVTREWELYSPLLADEALVVVDDICGMEESDMVRFWNGLDYEKFFDVHVHPGFPMGFLRYTRKG